MLASFAFAVIGGVIGIAWSSPSFENPQEPRPAVFRLRSEVPVGDIGGRQILEQMVDLCRDVEEVLLIPPPERPIQVNLFKSKDSFEAFLIPRIPSAKGRSAIYVDDPEGGQIYLWHHPDIEQDVRHECTHAILHQSFQEIPLWLDEGLAEYFEVRREDWAENHPYLVEFKTVLNSQSVQRLEALEALEHVNQLTPEDYRSAWAWVHFLMHGPTPAREEFRQYLIDLAADSKVYPLSERLRARMPDMEVQLFHHLQEW